LQEEYEQSARVFAGDRSTQQLPFLTAASSVFADGTFAEQTTSGQLFINLEVK
jgi:hypothetical protein